MAEEHVISRQRVADHGEVLTPRWVVNAILDLVAQETDRIDSRFLEPACGDGNFLAEVLGRKLRVVAARYRRSQLDYERHAILAVSSMYGIDVLEDNVRACRMRLFEVFDADYARMYKKKSSERCRAVVRYLLERNIVLGDALTLKTRGDTPQPIVFSEWSFARGSMIKRRDFLFRGLLEVAEMREQSLFSGLGEVSDLGQDVFIPMPVREYPLTHFLEVPSLDNH